MKKWGFYGILLLAIKAQSQCVKPTGTGDTLCGPTSVGLIATGASGFYAWFDSDSAGSLVSYNDTFSTPILNATRDYYVAEFDTGTTSNALSFDGINDYIAIDNIFYDGTNYTEVTVELWLRTTDGGNQTLVSFDRSEYWRLEINGEGAGTGQIGFDVLTDAGQHDFGGSILINDGVWHHVAAVFDNGTSRIYIDGVLDNAATVGTVFGIGGVSYGFVGVGSEASTFNGTTGPDNFFNGDMTEVRVWNRALTQAEIMSNMNNCIIQVQDSLAIYYRMDGSAGQTFVSDFSGNSNIGVLQNMNTTTAWINTGVSLTGCPDCYSVRDTVTAGIDLPLAVDLGIDTCIGSTITLDAGPG